MNIVKYSKKSKAMEGNKWHEGTNMPAHRDIDTHIDRLVEAPSPLFLLLLLPPTPLLLGSHILLFLFEC